MSKKLLTCSLAMACLSSASYAEEEIHFTNTCQYQGVAYTEGAIVEMAGVKRECRDRRYETIKYYSDSNDVSVANHMLLERNFVPCSKLLYQPTYLLLCQSKNQELSLMPQIKLAVSQVSDL